uniref:Uncharacterized protein n=1 Tax=Globodera rostochiensis TaxID=31243 RepID=A0A914HDA9_GLORO
MGSFTFTSSTTGFIFSALFVSASFAFPSFVGQKAEEDKRGFPVRNPYSWMAQLQKRSVHSGMDNTSPSDEELPNLLLEEPSKRSPSPAFSFGGRRPQNPYSWMSFGDADQSNVDWLFTRLRPFSELVSKRLNALGMGMGFRRPKNPYLWAMNRQLLAE